MEQIEQSDQSELRSPPPKMRNLDSDDSSGNSDDGSLLVQQITDAVKKSNRSGASALARRNRKAERQVEVFK